MHRDCFNDEKRINAAGIRARFGRRVVGRGRLARFEGVDGIARGINNHPQLASFFSEVEFVGKNGADSLFIASADLLDHPHIFVCYDSVGRAVVLPRHDLSIAMFGAPGTGKSTDMGKLAGQAAMLGDAVLIISMKTDDPVLIAQGKAGADAMTKVDEHGRLHSSPFYYLSLQPGQNTMGHNYVAALRNSNRQLWVNIEEGMMAAGFDERRMTGAELYFAGSFRKALRDMGDLGGSPRELTDRLTERVKKDRNADYATAGWRYKWEMLREIEQLNLPAEHPANINNEEVHRNGGVVYLAACYPETVGAGSLAAAFFAKDFCDAKRRVDPNRERHAWLFIDELQYFPQPFANQLITQARGEKIHLVIAQQNLEQAGDYIETVLQPSVKMIYSAQPGERTDRFLQAQFGTRRDFLSSFHNAHGSATSQNSAESVGPSGRTLSTSNGHSATTQRSYGLTERESLAWGPNDTAELNSDPNACVISVWPNAGCFQYGAIPILCRREGMLVSSFDEVEKIYRAVLTKSENTIFPGEEKPKLFSAPQLSPKQVERRRAWLAVFEKTAAQVRKAIGDNL